MSSLHLTGMDKKLQSYRGETAQVGEVESELKVLKEETWLGLI